MATFNNTATLTYNGNVVTSNTTTGELVEAITAAKTSVESSYEQNGTVTYVVTIVNSSTSAITGLQLSDNLGSYSTGSTTVVPLTYQTGSIKYYVNGTLQSTLTPSSTSPLTVSGISVPAGGSATIIYATEANQYAPPDTGGTITNTATISGDIPAPITAQATVDVSTEPNLTISKALSPTTITESGQVVYTITIENTGNTAASTGVVVSDTFNPVLSSLTAALNGTALTATTDYTYNTTTGAFATTTGTVTVPAATYTQDATTGVWSIVPGTATLKITGTI